MYWTNKRNSLLIRYRIDELFWFWCQEIEWQIVAIALCWHAKQKWFQSDLITCYATQYHIQIIQSNTARANHRRIEKERGNESLAEAAMTNGVCKVHRKQSTELILIQEKKKRNRFNYLSVFRDSHLNQPLPFCIIHWPALRCGFTVAMTMPTDEYDSFAFSGWIIDSFALLPLENSSFVVIAQRCVIRVATTLSQCRSNVLQDFTGERNTDKNHLTTATQGKVLVMNAFLIYNRQESSTINTYALMTMTNLLLEISSSFERIRNFRLVNIHFIDSQWIV